LQDIGAKRPADAATLALTFETALLAPRWPDFAAGLEVEVRNCYGTLMPAKGGPGVRVSGM
jgi:hypothetical protein